MQLLREKNKNLEISYVQLRQLIGYLGIGLPITCIVGGTILGKAKIQTTLSGYYFTNMRDVFIGIIIGMSLFLITYKGYERIDQLITTITGVFGLGIGIFPCNVSEGPDIHVGVFQLMSKTSNTIHALCALCFFFLLAINSIFIFTMTSDQHMTQRKKYRNLIYRSTGWFIIASIITLILFVLIVPQSTLETSHFILVLESLMLLAFGISWLIKGETLLRDKK